MHSILHSPVISDKKRKLLSPRHVTLQGAELPEGASSELATQAVDVLLRQSSSDHDVKNSMEQVRLSVLSQLKDGAEAARELGRQRGLQEGRAAGMEETRQDLSAEITRIRSIADKLPQVFNLGIDGFEDTLVAIVFDAVCKILGNAAVTREGVQHLVRQAASRVLAAEKIVVRLHASDLMLLRNAGALDAVLPSGVAVTWVPDKRIELGGCVIETDGGELDARLETQIQCFRAMLLATRKS